MRCLETSIAHIYLLYAEDYAHSTRTMVQRGGDEGCTLSQSDFKVGKHLPVTWRMDNVGKRRRSIAEDVSHHNHIVSILISIGDGIGACKSSKGAARVKTGRLFCKRGTLRRKICAGYGLIQVVTGL